jgi:hypothetical protein
MRNILCSYRCTRTFQSPCIHYKSCKWVNHVNFILWLFYKAWFSFTFSTKDVASNRQCMIRKYKFLSVSYLALVMLPIKAGTFPSKLLIKWLRFTTTSPALLTSWSPSVTSHSTTVQHGSVGSGSSTQRSSEVLLTGGHLHTRSCVAGH